MIDTSLDRETRNMVARLSRGGVNKEFEVWGGVYPGIDPDPWEVAQEYEPLARARREEELS